MHRDRDQRCTSVDHHNQHPHYGGPQPHQDKDEDTIKDAPHQRHDDSNHNHKKVVDDGLGDEVQILDCFVYGLECLSVLVLFEESLKVQLHEEKSIFKGQL